MQRLHLHVFSIFIILTYLLHIFFPSSRVWEIAFGVFVLFLLRKGQILKSFYKKFHHLYIFFIIIICMFLPIKYGLFTTTSVVVSTTLLLVSLREKTLLYKFFTNKKVVGIGLLSYSLYLWHWGVLSIFKTNH